MARFDLPIDALREARGATTEPADFDDRWAATIADAAAFGPALRSAVPVDTGLDAFTCLDVRFAGFGGDEIAAWYQRPRGATGPLPVVVEFPGYGRGRGLPHERLLWPAAGVAHLLVDIRGQGAQHGPGDTADPWPTPPSAPGSVTRGILDHETHYTRRLVTDAARAIRAARQLPGADPARIVSAGNSQGGHLALAAAALDGDVAATLSTQPFLCDPRRALDITEAAPWDEIVTYLASHRDDEDAVMRTLSYVDGVAFARRGAGPLHMSTGLRDAVCPPSTVFAAFNAWGERRGRHGETVIEAYPWNGHEGGDARHARRQLDWLRGLGVLPTRDAA